MLTLIQPLYEELAKKSDIEKFYGNYSATIPMKAEQLFPMLTKNAAMLLVLKLAEFFVQDVKRIKSGQLNLDANRNKTSNLTQKDIDCIQYLGGYVIHTLYRKVRNSKNYATLESQQMESILLSARKDDDSEQNLVREVH